MEPSNFESLLVYLEHLPISISHLFNASAGADPGFSVRGGAIFKKMYSKLFLLEAGVGGPGVEPPAAGGKG